MNLSDRTNAKVDIIEDLCECMEKLPVYKVDYLYTDTYVYKNKYFKERVSERE